MLPEGFEINLYAADPIIAKPIQINFDAAGRLWIASSETYPHILPGARPHDRVVVLEDRDHDGRSDQAQVFAEGLLIPTGVEPGDGGAYVANSTDLLHLSDTDGDGRADRSRVVLSGFGTEDTHHILHTLRFGPDGMLYFNQSIYIHSHIETPHGVRRLNGGGVWHFRPETLELGVFIRGLVNPWGHAFDRWGQSFGTDGAGGEGINYLLPGATYFTAPGAVRILPGLNPGSPKHCALEIVDGRHLSDDWQGSLITNDFRANRVCRFVVSDDGAGYASREQTELIRSTNVAFRPVDVKQGPDGAIYIADWYNPIIQHGEVDFRDPRRDHVHGRIWRVTAKGRPLVPRIDFAASSTPELLAMLQAPESWTRHFAKRTLKERGVSVIPELAAWSAALDPTTQDYEHHRLEALWTYQSLDVVEPDLLQSLLTARDPRVRAAATRVLRYWHPRISDALELLASRVGDEHPRVRLEAVRALAHVPDPRSIELALNALDAPMDRFLDYALWATSRDLAPVWLPELQAGRLHLAEQPAHFEFALTAVATAEVVEPLLGLLERGAVSEARQASVLDLIGTQGGTDQLRRLLDLVLKSAASEPGKALPLLAALSKASAQRQLQPSGDLSGLTALFATSDEGLRAAALRLAGQWRLEAARSQLAELVAAGDTALPPSSRQAAIEGLVALGGQASVDALAALVDGQRAAEVQTAAVVGIAALDPGRAATLAVQLLQSAAGNVDLATLLNVFVRRNEGTKALLAALTEQQLPPDTAKLALRVVRSAGRELPELIEALNRAGGLGAGPVALSPEQLAELVEVVKTQGDAARGEQIFRRQETACLKCHAIAGAGGRVGPDLVSIGGSAQIDYLVESILVPTKAVKENYHSLVVSTTDGQVFSGVPARQTDTELILRDAEDKEVVIPLESIDEKTPGGSIMPVGLVDTLTRAELVDLVRFLSELGKVGPYTADKARVARRWQAVENTPAMAQMIRYASGDLAAQAHPDLVWRSVYSRVDGTLPVEDLPALRVRAERPPTAYVRAEIEVTTAGPVRLLAGDTTGITFWLDSNKQALATENDLDLPAGRHIVCLAVDASQRTTPLRLELADAPNSPARAEWVTGK
ncbi:MAG: HEAT repeat domain-containing protein [Pirellulales bacterium]|nr:HEAT repeat domain-containing protein [Pirellulales bacterium]